jgi:competence protein ComEC
LGVATSTPAESTLPGRWSEDGRRRGPRWLAPGEPAVVVLLAVVVALVAWRRSFVEALVLAIAALAVTGRWRLGVGVAVIALFVVARSIAAHDELTPDRLGPFTGWAAVAADPRPANGATQVVLGLDGERFEMWVRGRANQLRVARWNQGDVVWVEGVRRPLDPHRAGLLAWRHVVGRFEHDVLGDRLAGRRLDVAANRVRALITVATSSLGSDDAALARGLIVGDDSDQSDEMIARFRNSGLSHLCAVSGQNVALAIAIAGPLLRRARPALRCIATLAVIGWFVVLTRAEPSVLRAGTMAALAALAFAVGSEREPARLLAAAVVILLALDPLLVHSIGFWLSVGATFGVTVLGPPLRGRLSSLGVLATPVAMSVAAQVGVVVPSVLVFGRLPLIGVAANLVAVPVAGWVMLYGLPASLVAGAVPAVRTVVMAPVAVGVRWVDTVAEVASSVEQQPPWNVVVSIVVLVTIAIAGRRRTCDNDRP